MRFAQEISVFNPFAIERAVIGLNTSITQTSERIELQAQEIAVVNGKVETATASLTVMAQQIESKVEDSTFNTAITQLSNQITSKVSRGDVVSVINQSADQITISSNRIKIDSTYFHLTTDGQITATRGIIGNASAQSANKWTIGGDTSRAWIYSGSKTNTKTSVPGVYIGTNGIEVKQSTGDDGNVTRIDGDGILTTYLVMYDSGLRQSAWMFLDTEGEYQVGDRYRMQFPAGIVTGASGTQSSNNYFYNNSYGLHFYETSDRKAKKDIKELDREKSIEFIKNLVPTEFRYICQDDELHHGFIAQDTEAIGWDGLVNGDNNKSIAYTEIIADIVVVLQELLKGA